jgi:flagellar secretion chaperone FliS
MYAAASVAAFQGAGPLAGIEQASPHQQIELLLGGLLTRLARIRAAIRANQLPQRTEAANRALDILAYLRTILDPTADPQLVGSLRDLYRYCEARLLEACQANDEDAVVEVVSLITEVKSAWDAIAPQRVAAA